MRQDRVLVNWSTRFFTSDSDFFYFSKKTGRSGDGKRNILWGWPNKFYGCIDLRMIFQSARRINSFFPYKDMINHSQRSKVVYKASCWDCQDFYIGKTKRRLHDRKTEHFKGITSTCHESAIAEHVTSTGHYLKWDHFEILAKERSDTHCKIKETLIIQELRPILNDSVSSKNLYDLY